MRPIVDTTTTWRPGELADRPAWRVHPSGFIVALIALAGLAVASVAYFDLSAALPFNDDAVFAWGVQHLDLHHLRLYPGASALALPQIVSGWLLTFSTANRSLLKLSLLPYVAVTVYCSFKLASSAGADTRWALVAAVATLANPIFLANSSAFMSDVPYVALVLANLYAASRWIQDRKSIALCVATAGLATLQRQYGAVGILPIVAALMIGRHWNPSRRDWGGIVALSLVTAIAVIGPVVLHIAPPTEANRIADLASIGVPPRLGVIGYFWPTVGLSLLPFALPAWTGIRHFDSVPRLAGPLLLGLVLLVPALGFGSGGGIAILPGNILIPAGLGPATLHHSPKNVLYPYWLLAVVSLLAVLVLGAFVFVRFNYWKEQARSPIAALLLLAAAAQILPLFLLSYSPLDRYYLPIAAPLIPLAAAYATRCRSQTLALCSAIIIASVGVLAYIIGEQDYTAWQVARATAASVAYCYASPFKVDAGYEENLVNAEIPYYDATGRTLGGLAIAGKRDWSIEGPPSPDVVLTFGHQDGSLARPDSLIRQFSVVRTVAYRSLVSGTIVVTVRGGYRPADSASCRAAG